MENSPQKIGRPRKYAPEEAKQKYYECRKAWRRKRYAELRAQGATVARAMLIRKLSPEELNNIQKSLDP